MLLQSKIIVYLQFKGIGEELGKDSGYPSKDFRMSWAQPVSLGTQEDVQKAKYTFFGLLMS